jgi:hypothetical protein
MNLILCLIVALIVAGAVMGVVRAVLALESWSWFAPYGGVIYALIVLLIVLAIINYCFGIDFLGSFPRHVR